ncbi:hypothetical protein Q8F55_006262 [Vanrija albida]|uniref:Enoyl reductase (ER) domain-containing protein n=1 Tax=Vanrija albida TaxID=181172 RepID=A0ABR3PWK9_9TREE
MPTSPPATAPAWEWPARGLAWDVLRLNPARPVPTLPPPTPLPSGIDPAEEWLLVKVAFAGLNPGAIFQINLVPGFLRPANGVPEMDLSGVVVDTWRGDEAAPSRFKKGDGVYAMLPASYTLPSGTGALAAYARIPARYAVPKPPHVSFSDLAGCGIAALTAHEMLGSTTVKPGGRVLVNAASGGIGTMVVQMARAAVGKEGFVVGVCSGKNAALVRDLGADEVVDYTAHASVGAHLAATYAPFDAAFDTLGHQALYLASPTFLAPEADYVSVGIKPPTFFVPDFLRAVLQMKLNEWWPTSTSLGGVGRKWVAVAMMSPTLADREAVVYALAAGDIKVVRDSVWPFDEAKEAYKHLGGLHARGKVLVKVDAGYKDDE